MATVVRREIEPRSIVLRGVPYRVYERLRDEPENDHIRMTYNDGTLEIRTPGARHDRPSRLLCLFIIGVATDLGIHCLMFGSSTVKKPGDGPKKGKGKEPDESFYFENFERVMKNDTIDLEIDPPPDLWIEVDNWNRSAGCLPLYAALGVPEVWRYRARKKTIWFGGLTHGSYQPIENSVSLPKLTPALVLEGLALGEGVDDQRVRGWIRDRLTTA